MQWHTDNKTDMEFSISPGLIFIFYVSDVAEGEFQYIEGSHNWSGHTAYNDYSDQYIEENHADAVRSFKYPKGSLVIYNTYGVHRAHPVKNRSFVRKSVFFQVDGDLSNSEPIIINTALHHKREEWVEKLLGFGLRGDYKVFPVTGIKGLPVMDYFKFVGLGSYSLLDRSLRYLIPVRYLRKIKMLLLKK
jgi:ectoine hydroxylase-related dioxygenase (phytanoyl-CoA dioxygenase family)